MNAQNFDIRRNVLILQDVSLSAAKVVRGDFRDGGGVGDAADEQHGGEHKADFDRHSQIRQNGKQKRHAPHCSIVPGEPENFRDLLPLAHVVSHHKQDGRQTRHGDVTGQRRGEEQDQQ